MDNLRNTKRLWDYSRGSRPGVLKLPGKAKHHSGGTRSVRLNQRKLIYQLLSCGSFVFFATDYRQKCEARSDLYDTILLIHLNITYNLFFGPERKHWLLTKIKRF